MWGANIRRRSWGIISGGLFFLPALFAIYERPAHLQRYFGRITMTESVWPLPSSSVAELDGSISPSPSTRNL